MSIITEQDQNNIYDLYQEGILTRARAGLGSFIGGSGVEGKLNNIIAQYKTKIGRELGDLEADFKTFKGSIQPAQQAKLNTLLTNLGGVGVQSAQSMLGKFGHMIGRVVGAAAPAAAVGAATAALGGAPALVGAAAGLTRGMRNVPRTDITGFDKLGRVATATGIGALAGYGTGKLGEYMSKTGAPAAPAPPLSQTSQIGVRPEMGGINSPQIEPLGVNNITDFSNTGLSPQQDIGNLGPSFDTGLFAAKKALGTMPDALRPSAQDLMNQMSSQGYSPTDVSNKLKEISTLFTDIARIEGPRVANKDIMSLIQGEISDLAVNTTPLDRAVNILKSAMDRGISGEQLDRIQQSLIRKAVERGAPEAEIQSIRNIASA